eukprot:SAG31_NODE_1766_length_7315_cov_2.439302_2_plen_86_part_00
MGLVRKGHLCLALGASELPTAISHAGFERNVNSCRARGGHPWLGAQQVMWRNREATASVIGSEAASEGDILQRVCGLRKTIMQPS